MPEDHDDRLRLGKANIVKWADDIAKATDLRFDDIRWSDEKQLGEGATLTVRRGARDASEWIDGGALEDAGDGRISLSVIDKLVKMMTEVI